MSRKRKLPTLGHLKGKRVRRALSALKKEQGERKQGRK
jgi:hypothetical protein